VRSQQFGLSKVSRCFLFLSHCDDWSWKGREGPRTPWTPRRRHSSWSCEVTSSSADTVRSFKLTWYFYRGGLGRSTAGYTPLLSTRVSCTRSLPLNLVGQT